MLSNIQATLKAPKNQFNDFGKYKYRSCEDIVEAVKPLLAAERAYLLLSDEMIEVGGRVYVKATASIKMDDGKLIESVTACAREAEIKKGMDDSQITGTSSSYARKYALNGLFAIDDTKDADTDAHSAVTKPTPLSENVRANFLSAIESSSTVGELKHSFSEAYHAAKESGDKVAISEFSQAKNQLKSKLENES